MCCVIQLWLQMAGRMDGMPKVNVFLYFCLFYWTPQKLVWLGFSLTVHISNHWMLVQAYAHQALSIMIYSSRCTMIISISSSLDTLNQLTLPMLIEFSVNEILLFACSLNHTTFSTLKWTHILLFCVPFTQKYYSFHNTHSITF